MLVWYPSVIFNDQFLFWVNLTVVIVLKSVYTSPRSPWERKIKQFRNLIFFTANKWESFMYSSDYR